MVFDAESNVIANLQAVTAQEVADLVGRIVELLVGQYRTSCGINDGRFVGRKLCIMSWKHVCNGSPYRRLAS
jgi:hypothetical protein